MKKFLSDNTFVPVADALGCIPSVRIIGKSTTEITNHKGLKSFENREISIFTAVGPLHVEGFNLEVEGITQECVRIKGDIRRIFYQ